MNLEFQVKIDKLLVNMRGELDHHSAEEVRNRIDDRLDRDGLNKLIMDFSGVSFMDSSGIGVVIGRYKKLDLKNGSMCIVGANDLVKRVVSANHGRYWGSI